MKRHWLWLLILIPVALGLARVRFDVEVLNLLPSHFAVVDGLKLYQRSFSNARELIVTVDSDDPNVTEHAAQTLAEELRAHPKLVSSAVWQPPFLEAPDQSAELIAYLWLNQAPRQFEQLLARLRGPGLTNSLLAAREELATSMSPDRIARRAYDPFDLMTLPEGTTPSMPGTSIDQGLFASSNGRFRALFVEATSPLQSYRECLRWLETIQSIVEAALQRHDLPSGIQIAYTGRPAFVAEIAGGMERDIVASVGGTLVIIALLFYVMHRRWKPLLWLVAMLALILGSTTALGGLAFGSLSVVSLGFAAILLGLAADYGLVLYQEAVSSPGSTTASVRASVGPGIVWSATTTSVAFALLNLSGLPGLAQLGSLVAIGLVLAAGFMLLAFLPPLIPSAAFLPQPPPESESPPQSRVPTIHHPRPALVWIGTVTLLAVSVAVLQSGGPRFDHSADALRPADSEAYATIERMKARLGHERDPLWILVRGHDETEVAHRLTQLSGTLSNALERGVIDGFTLPLPLWANPPRQASNKAAFRAFLDSNPPVHDATLALGFNTNALALTERILHAWKVAAASDSVFWPTNPGSRWLLGKVVSRSDTELVALGLIYPPPGEAPGSTPQTQAALGNWINRLQTSDVIVSGWQLMGGSVFEVVRHDLPRILVPMVLLILLALGLAFRSAVETLLSLLTLAVSALALWTVMSLAGWSWNLINMMALPLLLGAGVDYSIHMQLGLKRHRGNVGAVNRTVGRALLLCASTTCAAFASLGLSSNAGLASLGRVCAAGIVCAFVTAVLLLPGWWSLIRRLRPAA